MLSAGAQYAPAILHVQIAKMSVTFCTQSFHNFFDQPTHRPTKRRNEAPWQSLKSDKPILLAKVVTMFLIHQTNYPIL